MKECDWSVYHPRQCRQYQAELYVIADKLFTRTWWKETFNLSQSISINQKIKSTIQKKILISKTFFQELRNSFFQVTRLCRRVTFNFCVFYIWTVSWWPFLVLGREWPHLQVTWSGGSSPCVWLLISPGNLLSCEDLFRVSCHNRQINHKVWGGVCWSVWISCWIIQNIIFEKRSLKNITNESLHWSLSQLVS